MAGMDDIEYNVAVAPLGAGHGTEEELTESELRAAARSAQQAKVLAAAFAPHSELFPLSRDDNIGPQLFTKLKLLGRGAVGKVYLVLLKEHQKVYAMKVLTKQEMLEKNKINRVLTEREIFATVNHPLIVTMYASFQTTEKLYYVMDYCQGGEFYQFLQAQPKHRLPESAARFYVAEVVLALEYLHHMGFIYRDLKPENVLMKANGHIALTDFDLSKQAQAISPKVIEHHLSLTQKVKRGLNISHTGRRSSLEIVDSPPVMTGDCNSFVGTEEYIAPEIVEGTNQTAAVDWWTVGILAYEMVYGCTPFKGETQDATFENILGGRRLTFPNDGDSSTSKEFKDFVKSLLRKDTQKRLGSMHGASELKSHKWFRSLNMDLIRNAKAPAVPKLKDPLDLSQYKPIKNADFEGEGNVISPNSDKDPFSTFDIRVDRDGANDRS